MRVRARDVAWRVADNDDSIGVDVEWQAARASAVELNRNEMVAIVRVFAKGAAAEVPPEVEMTEFHLRGLGIIAGQQTQERPRLCVEPAEHREDAREHLLPRRCLRNFLAQAVEVT